MRSLRCGSCVSHIVCARAEGDQWPGGLVVRVDGAARARLEVLTEHDVPQRTCDRGYAQEMADKEMVGRLVTAVHLGPEEIKLVHLLLRNTVVTNRGQSRLEQKLCRETHLANIGHKVVWPDTGWCFGVRRSVGFDLLPNRGVPFLGHGIAYPVPSAWGTQDKNPSPPVLASFLSCRARTKSLQWVPSPKGGEAR